MISYTQSYLEETHVVLEQIDPVDVERLARELAGVRNRGGRLFILGVGGSAGHASHAVNDFRKICGFEAYSPGDNVSELTARVNDEGWDTCFSNWLSCSRLNTTDGLLIFSVGGGNLERNVSVNLVRSIELARRVGAKVFGIVGRDGGSPPWQRTPVSSSRPSLMTASPPTPRPLRHALAFAGHAPGPHEDRDQVGNHPGMGRSGGRSVYLQSEQGVGRSRRVRQPWSAR